MQMNLNLSIGAFDYVTCFLAHFGQFQFSNSDLSIKFYKKKDVGCQRIGIIEIFTSSYECNSSAIYRFAMRQHRIEVLLLLMNVQRLWRVLTLFLYNGLLTNRTVAPEILQY